MSAGFLRPSRIPGPSVFASSISDKGVESPTALASQKMPPSSPTPEVRLQALPRQRMRPTNRLVAALLFVINFTPRSNLHMRWRGG